MIGWINNSVESFVRDTFGDEIWNSVLITAGVGTGGWVSSCPYPDSETYKLVITASGLLGVTPAVALEAYGVYFVDYVTKQGYDKLLQTLGSNIAEFLQSLNNLHLHLTLSFPAMSAPAFKCAAVGPESLELHYHSHRPALGPIVVGVLRGLAERYWGLADQLTVKLLRGREDGTDDHEVFLVTYPYQEALRDWEGDEAAARGRQQQRTFTVPPDTFCAIFPFHILMDRHCRVLQAGAALARLFPELAAPGAALADTFQLRHPYGALDYDSIISELNNAFLLKAKATGLELKGQMLPVPLPPPTSSPPSPSPPGHASGATAGAGCPYHRAAMAAAATSAAAPSPSSPSSFPSTPLNGGGGGGGRGGGVEEGLLFLGTARLAGLDDMRQQRLYLSDIPLHDLNRDFVLLAEQRQAEAQLKERFEALSLELKQVNASLCETSRWLEEERRRSDQLLYQMLPPQVATVLKQGARMPASEHPEATVLFSDIVGFTEIASRCSPLEVCSLLDELYHHFDTAIEHYPQLYKVETIGDAYMVVANVTTPCPDHADVLLEFAVAMHAVARRVRCGLGEQLRIRVGMHTGPVVAGVVGKKMPRFCLFGDTVNTASRMESHGLPGHIHISAACYSRIRNKQAFVIRERGNISVKGKGMMRTYLIAPAEQEATLSAFTRLHMHLVTAEYDSSQPKFIATGAPVIIGGGAAAAAGPASIGTSALPVRRMSSPAHHHHHHHHDALGPDLSSRLASFASVSGLSDIAVGGPEERTSFASVASGGLGPDCCVDGAVGGGGLDSALPPTGGHLTKDCRHGPRREQSRLSRTGAEAELCTAAAGPAGCDAAGGAFTVPMPTVDDACCPGDEGGGAGPA